MVTDMKTDEIDNNFQMVTSSDGDINERANEVHFFYFHTSAGLKTSTQLQLNLNWSSFQLQPQFSLPSTLNSNQPGIFPISMSLGIPPHPPPQICAIELDLL